MKEKEGYGKKERRERRLPNIYQNHINYTKKTVDKSGRSTSEIRGRGEEIRGREKERGINKLKHNIFTVILH